MEKLSEGFDPNTLYQLFITPARRPTLVRVHYERDGLSEVEQQVNHEPYSQDKDQEVIWLVTNETQVQRFPLRGRIADLYIGEV